MRGYYYHILDWYIPIITSRFTVGLCYGSAQYSSTGYYRDDSGSLASRMWCDNNGLAYIPHQRTCTFM